MINNYPIAAPGVAMARDRTGVAIAWMMANAAGATRIYVARLDTTAHIAGGVQEIPIASTVSGAAAVYPSVAPSVTGDGFTLAWTEIISLPPLPAAQAVYCHLDAALQPSPPVAFLLTNNLTTPAIVRSGRTRTWITVNGLVLENNADGSLQLPLDGGVVAADMIVATDFPQLVGIRKVSDGFICRTPCPYSDNHSWGCRVECWVHNYSTIFTFTALYKASVAVPFPFDSDAQPSLQTDGHDVLMAWYNSERANGGDVVAARLDPSVFDFRNAVKATLSLGTFGRDGGQTRPDIATDGQRYVVVWRTAVPNGTHDIVGASLDGSDNVTPFSIATSSADERDPSIIAVGNGVFLVAYQKFNGGELRIAGRSVTFGGRRRAVN